MRAPDRTLHGAAIRMTVVERSRGLARLDLRDIWKNRDLLKLFVWRDLKVRYKQTAIGAAWAILQPLLLMALFAVVFGLVLKIDIGDVPRPLFFYSALVPWTYFSAAINGATTSVVNNQAVITKVYFPRVVLPIASVIPNLVDLGISSLLLLGMGLAFGYRPTIGLVFIPLFVLMVVLTALGFGLWLSALNARYRDVQYGIAFFVQLWFFASPIFYPSSFVPPAWRTLFALNPLVGVIDGFRWAFVRQEPPGRSIWVSIALVAIVFVSGLWFFRTQESSVVDVV